VGIGSCTSVSPGYGVAVTNDSTYGHDVSRRTRTDGGTTTTVRESLLRAPLYPDPNADQGRHVLRTTVRPGADMAQAVEEGYQTNLPLRYVAWRPSGRAARLGQQPPPSWWRPSS
jgi:alpha-mannosidase